MLKNVFENENSLHFYCILLVKFWDIGKTSEILLTQEKKQNKNQQYIVNKKIGKAMIKLKLIEQNLKKS